MTEPYINREEIYEAIGNEREKCWNEREIVCYVLDIVSPALIIQKPFKYVLFTSSSYLIFHIINDF